MSAEEHNLVLILARGLASSIATPVFLVDPDGNLAYFNEPAEEILGQRYAETGELKFGEWATLAVQERKPAHRQMQITGTDGEQRDIAVTAFPLWARTDDFVGAVAIFWEEKG